MATSDFTVISTEQSHAGAHAALAALKNIQAICMEADAMCDGDPMQPWFDRCDRAVAETLRAAGDPGELLSGFIAVLVEHVHATSEGLSRDVEGWMPEATMTHEEKAEARARISAEAEADAESSCEAAEDKMDRIERAYAEASPLAIKWLEGLPGDEGDFKRQAARLMEDLARLPDMARERGGYSFDRETLREYDSAVVALADVLKRGKVRFSQFARDMERERLAGEAFDRCRWLTGFERDELVQRVLRQVPSQDGGCSHGMIRLPYEREFTPCRCGRAPA